MHFFLLGYFGNLTLPLGGKKIEFDKDGDSNHVHDLLVKYFSKLEDGGGYEIMRSTDRKGSLTVIPMSPVGYSVAYLQGVLSQAKAETCVEKPGFGYRTSCNGKGMKFDGVSLNTKS